MSAALVARDAAPRVCPRSGLALDERMSQWHTESCEVCGTKANLRRRSRHGEDGWSYYYRCRTCCGLRVARARERGSIVAHGVPYELDEAVKRFVAEHPGGATLDEVGVAFGVSRERIRQIENAALAKLRRRLELGLGLRRGDL